MRPLNFISNYFNFNKRERNGIIILLLFLFILMSIKIILINLKTEPSIEISYIPLNHYSEKKIIHSIANSKNSNKEKLTSNHLLFNFNPNTINEEDAKKLGFSDKLAQTLLHYRNKGGKFKNKEDFKKLYGLKLQQYQKLETYIRIPEIKVEKFDIFKKKNNSEKLPLILELNMVDSIELLKLKGIGPTFSKRILNFRNLLGGFYSIQQLKEVYGLNDTTFALIEHNLRVNPELIQKININTISYQDLKKHPYFRGTIGYTIINYRQKHGSFKTASDLLKIGTINQESLKKIEAYLLFD